MNTEEAVAKINKAGGNFNRLSSEELYDVFRALQGSFKYSDELNRLTAFADANKATLSADPKLQDKLLGDIKTNSENLEEFKNSYQAVSLFAGNAAIKNRFAKEAFNILENFSAVNTFSPEDLDDLEVISKALKEDIDNGVIVVKANEKKAVEKFIQRVENETETFVKANDLENVHTLNANQIDEGFAAAEKINAELANATGFYADEIKKTEDLLNALEIDKPEGNSATDALSTEQFRQDLYDLATEQAMRKCAIDPTYATKDPHEQKLQLIAAKNEAVEDLVRKALLTEAIAKAERQFQAGKISAKEKKEFEKKSNLAFDDFVKGKNKKIVINKEAALATLDSAEKSLKAAAKYIAKKTGFDKFLNRTKKRIEEFEEKYPKQTKIAKMVATTILKGGAKMGAVLGATALFANPAAGMIVSTIFAGKMAYNSFSALKKKYKEDPAYEGKKFKDYMKDNKLATGAVIATAVGGALMGSLTTLGLSGVGFDAAVRRIGMASTGFATGAATSADRYIKATTSKEKKWAVVAIAGAGAAAAVTAFFGDDIAKFVQEKLGIVGFGKGNKSSADTTLENIADDKNGTVVDQEGKKGWLDRFFGGKDKNPVVIDPDTSNETTPPVAEGDTGNNGNNGKVEPDYSREFDASTAETIEKGAYRRSTEYTRTYMQALENEKGSGVTVTRAMAEAQLNAELTNFKDLSPDLIKAAASRGISPEEMMNLAHMEELQFSHTRYLKDYSATIILEDGREYQISATSMSKDVIGDCNGLSVKDKLQIVDHARSHYDMVNGGKVVAPGWNPMDVKAGIGLKGCGTEDEIRYENFTKKTTNTNEVIETIKETKIIDDFSDINIHDGDNTQEETITIHETEVPAAEAPVVEEKPQEQQQEQPKQNDGDHQEYHEVLGDNFTASQLEQGQIPTEDGGLKYVGPEAAEAYYADFATRGNTYAKNMINSGWAVPFNKDFSMISGDSVATQFVKGMESTDVFMLREGDNSSWYFAGGGEMHELLAQKYPEQYGDSYKQYQELLKVHGEANAPVVTQNTAGETTVRANTKNSVSTEEVVNMKRAKTK